MVQRRPPEPPPTVIKDFSPEEIERGISKLKKRITELEALDPARIRHSDAVVESLEYRIRETIREVFGQYSPEFKKYGHISIYHDTAASPTVLSHGEDIDAHIHRKFVAGIPHTRQILEPLIKWLEEKKGDLTVDKAGKAKISLQGMDLHPRIADVSVDLFNDEHYAEAVFNASKAIVNYVKERSGRFDLDGANLMRTVFSRQDPILAFNDQQDQSDLDEQKGMMHLFEGAVLAIRNPRGHSFWDDSPQEAAEYIGLLSLLANRLTRAKRRK